MSLFSPDKARAPPSRDQTGSRNEPICSGQKSISSFLTLMRLTHLIKRFSNK